MERATKARRSSLPLATSIDDDNRLRFVGVDLHIESRHDLAPLLAAADLFGSAQTWTHRGTYSLHASAWPMLGTRRRPKGPSDAILQSARCLRRLRGAANREWRRASVKELDIGIECGSEPTAAEWTLSTEALRAAAAVGVQLRITVYAGRPSGGRRPKGNRTG